MLLAPTQITTKGTAYLPNRRIDLLGIDEMTRLNANMIHQMHTADMAEMLKADKVESER